MITKLQESERVVGTKQLLRALEAGGISRVYVAQDADIFVTRRVLDKCREQNIPVVEVATMKQLGEACGIQVGTAAAGLKK